MIKKIQTNTAEQAKNKIVDLVIPKSSNLKNDVLSGLTVALALVPEAIAFSFVVGVDPKIGLYAAFMMGLIAAVLGGRPGMISGATGAVAVIFAPLVITQVKIGGMDQALGYLFAAVALMGVIQILFGLFRVGKFVRLIPHPVMLGFVNGLAIIIFMSQLGQFYTGTGPDATLLPTPTLLIMFALIALTMIISRFLPRITKAVPATLAAIVVVTVISYFLNHSGYEVLTVLDFVKMIDPTKTTVAASLPSFGIPNIPFTMELLKQYCPIQYLLQL